MFSGIPTDLLPHPLHSIEQSPCLTASIMHPFLQTLKAGFRACARQHCSQKRSSDLLTLNFVPKVTDAMAALTRDWDK